jgi:hypothetical protein
LLVGARIRAAGAAADSKPFGSGTVSVEAKRFAR